MNSKTFFNWFDVSGKNLNKGINFGHKSIRLSKSSFWHPLMSNYFLGIRENSSILNAQQTLKCLLRAFHILALILKKKGRILIINTNPEFFRLCSNLSQLTGVGQSQYLTKLNVNSSLGVEKTHNPEHLKTPLISYVSFKWIGGTLTNWKQISKSVLTYAKFSERCENFILNNTIDFPKLSRVKKCFQGLLYKKNRKMLLGFNEKPDLIFLINPNENQIILNEAEKLHIPVIAFTESSTNPKQITYPIPINNYSIKFIYFCLKKIIKTSTI